MLTIVKITYSNEHGELIDIDFQDTELEYRADRVTDLVREMLAGGRDMGPPPRPKQPDMQGEVTAW